MLLINKNEEQRSKIWRISIVVATIMIIVVTSYFLYKMFTENPITGTWTSQTSGVTLNIHDNGEVEIVGADFDVEGRVSYHMNTESKSITFTLSQGDFLEGQNTNEDETIYTITYNYSIEQEILTLTDMEFGNVENFIKL